MTNLDAAALTALRWGSIEAPAEPDTYPLVEVLFVDARAIGVDNWIELSDAIDARPIRSVAVGFMVSYDQDSLNLIALVNEAHVGHGLTIPTAWVQDVRYL